MAPARSARPSRTPRKPLASSSRVTINSLPPVDVPESITPDYVPTVGKPREALSEDERARLVHELVGFNPRSLTGDVTEGARTEVYSTVNSIEEWARKSAPNTTRMEAELTMGLVALETLLESHVDKAFDKFTAWVLRNAFEFPPELEVVLPWQKGLDFPRGEYVAAHPKGRAILDESLEDLRTKVEQARLLAQRFDIAEKKLDRRLEIAKQRKAEVGFVKEIVEQAGLHPLPQYTSQLIPTLNQLQSAMTPLDGVLPASVPPVVKAPSDDRAGGTKAFELGRASYMNWRLGKLLPDGAVAGAVGAGPAGGSGTEGDKLEGIEQEIAMVTGSKGQYDGADKVLGNVQ
ncbi:hypothetical protein IAU60_004864 [Kwoniella sp. DSM 27419]